MLSSVASVWKRQSSSAAFAALGTEDMDSLCQFFERLKQGTELSEALANCTAAETAGIERFNVEIEAAALRIKGRPLSKAETKSVTIRLRRW